MSRAKTAEEVRQEFLGQIRIHVTYWAGNAAKDMSIRTRLDGLAFSIFNIFDGTSSWLPSMDIVLRPHPDDKAYHQNDGENWYEDGQVINESVMLHDAWYEKKAR